MLRKLRAMLLDRIMREGGRKMSYSELNSSAQDQDQWYHH